MATTQEILDSARKLGELIAQHDAAKRFEQAAKQFNDNVESQRLLTDYQRHLNAISQKEAQGRPIEVADKRKLEELQTKLSREPVLGRLQMAQMDYLDLMRQVDEAIEGVAAPADAPAVTAGVEPGAAAPGRTGPSQVKA